MYVYTLMTQWKDDDPVVSGVFSSFNRAVACFVHELFKNETMPVAEMQSAVVHVALKMAHMTDDEDFSNFGSTRAWVEKHEVDGCCENWEKEACGDSE